MVYIVFLQEKKEVIQKIFFMMMKLNYKEENKEEKKERGDSKGETECRRVLQKIFQRPFLKARPDFLNNPVTGNQFNLELDCYDHSLKLAVEYNGQQHYQYNKFFHRNKEHFS